MADPKYPPLATLGKILAASPGGNIGMPGSEVYPPESVIGGPHDVASELAAHIYRLQQQMQQQPPLLNRSNILPVGIRG